MKILFITPSFYPNIGGVEKSVAMVAREFTLSGNEVTIITERTKSNSLPFETFSGYFIYRIPKSPIWKTSLLLKWLWFFFHIRLLLKSDVIHFHDFGTLIFWFLPIRFILFFKRYYITFHGYEGYPIKKSHILLRKLCEKLTRGNICVGSYISKWYKTKPDFIYHAATDLKDNEYYVADPKNILFFGRLEYDTGILSYIEALRLFYKNNNYNYTFQICGNGNLKKTVLSLLNEYKIPYEYCDFQSEIEPFIQKAKIILVSSYLSIIESISSGKLVIAFYDNPLKKDYLITFPEQDKLYFCTDSIEGISSLMYDIWQHPEKFNQMTDYGPEFARKHNWSLVKEKYKMLYNIK